MTDNTFFYDTFEIEHAWGSQSEAASDQFDRNQARAEKAGLDPCLICGRGIKADSGSDVMLVHGGSVAVRNGLEPSDVGEYGPGYMGFWAIGPECQKKVPSAFRRPRK